jgi:uncharacterized protein
MSPPGSPLRTWWPVALVVAVLTTSNIMTNRVLPGWAYAPWGVLLTATLLSIAWADGCRTAELGLSRRALGRGLVVGATVAGLIVGAYLVAVALPPTRELFDDARVHDTSGWGAIFQVGVRIPLGTVLAEEVAFRGVLLAMLVRRVGPLPGVIASSAAFGLWHVLPSLGIEATNPVLGDRIGAAVAVPGAVAGTALAGALFAWLRLRSASLAAPMLVHLATNSAGFTISWIYLALR